MSEVSVGVMLHARRRMHRMLLLGLERMTSSGVVNGR